MFTVLVRCQRWQWLCSQKMIRVSQVVLVDVSIGREAKGAKRGRGADPKPRPVHAVVATGKSDAALAGCMQHAERQI